jgi:hypothetical protein
MTHRPLLAALQLLPTKAQVFEFMRRMQTLFAWWRNVRTIMSASIDERCQI